MSRGGAREWPAVCIGSGRRISTADRNGRGECPICEKDVSVSFDGVVHRHAPKGSTSAEHRRLRIAEPDSR